MQYKDRDSPDVLEQVNRVLVKLSRLFNLKKIFELGVDYSTPLF